MPRLNATLRFSLWLPLAAAAAVAVAAPLEFNRDIRPILSENCFQCHGQDATKREAKLRLDERESATLARDGIAAIVPGKPNESEMLRRIASTDASEHMPPAESHKAVTPAQAALLRQWIAEGANYQKHWAFEPARRPGLPVVRDARWTRGPIDRFILARLEREGLKPAAECTPEAWLRRASLDLVGLPPTPTELDAFAADVAKRGERAYVAAADRLIASPHYGERLAIDWLDAARYADTHGFNNDSTRTMWRWRDWAIEAFNANLPYDRFITEQLAGDLLPKPTLDQRIATGFGRNHVISSEGGIIEEEYRVEYVADRVRTLSTVWLGLTMECARCHDHKFDPVTQRDYYRLFAFFNNVPEHGEDGRVANAVPMIPAPTREQQAALATQERELAALDAKLRAPRAAWRLTADLSARAEALIAEARAAREIAEAAAKGAPLLTPYETPPTDRATQTIPSAKLDLGGKAGATVSFWLRPDAENPRDVALLSAIDYKGSAADAQYAKGSEVRLIDGEIEVRLSSRYPAYALVVRSEAAALHAGSWRHVAVSYSGGRNLAALRIFVDGTEVATRALYDGLQAEPPRRDFLVGRDNAKDSAPWRGELRALRGFTGAISRAAIRTELLTTVDLAEQGGALRELLLADSGAGREQFSRRNEIWEAHLALGRSLPTAMVMQELPEPRAAFVLSRGRYDAPADPVEPGAPETLLAPWPLGAPRNRLGLARWLTQPQHPLTARVVVNRFWAQLFGTGIVKTLEDFGSQSEWPSHPELLDFLARDFVDGGWNVKALFKSLVLSATYRQSSAVTPALLVRDPDNRLLARGPRVRLPAELIRDQALAVAGLLDARIGGPSVFPYQPEKLYEGIVVGADYPGAKWLLSTGGDLHRRSLYTFWKRTITHPAMTTFDAPDREFCTVRRSRTNTPLQALTLWNEPGNVEAARHLGARMLREPGDDAARVGFAFRCATGRRATAAETRVLTTAFAKLRAEFAANPDDAGTLLKVGATVADASLNPAELAAATSVASMILSLDETITKN